MSANESKSQQVSACIKVAACVCGKDGVISEIEEQAIIQIVTQRFSEISQNDIEQALCEVFDSDLHIENYLELVEDQELRKFAICLAEESASADGLNIKENIALLKAYLVWGIQRNA